MNNVPQENTSPNPPVSGTPPVNTPQSDSTIVPRVRTYSGDVQHVVQSGNVSQVNILVSEKKRQLEQKAVEPEVAENREKKPIGLILGYTLAILLFLAGGVGIFLFFQSSLQTNNGTTPINNTLSSIIPAQSTKQLTLERNDSIPQIKNKISEIKNSITEASGLFVNIVPSVIALNEAGERADEEVTLESLFTRITAVDDGFGRLGEKYMYGIHAGENPFLLIQVSDADEAYGRLFDWEKRMAIDLAPLFSSLEYESIVLQPESTVPPSTEAPESPETAKATKETIDTRKESEVNAVPQPTSVTPTEEEVAATKTTAAETPAPAENKNKEEIVFAPRDASFSDAIFYNFDARVIKDTRGNVRFMYAFIDKSLVVFATSPETLRDIATELKNRTIAR